MTDQPKHQVALDEVYDFLPENEDEVMVRAPAAEDRAAEDRAVHTIPDSPRLGVADPARRESAVGDEPDEEQPPTSWFEDEEHEDERTPDDIVELETADVEEVLIAQHYAFEADSETEEAENEEAERAVADVEQ